MNHINITLMYCTQIRSLQISITIIRLVCTTYHLFSGTLSCVCFKGRCCFSLFRNEFLQREIRCNETRNQFHNLKCSAFEKCYAWKVLSSLTINSHIDDQKDRKYTCCFCVSLLSNFLNRKRSVEVNIQTNLYLLSISVVLDKVFMCISILLLGTG